jgi:nicotinate-nucleotide adenylyltransferase
MRIGLLGGSFNPPHNGHLAMARAAKDAHGLDEVWLLVAARPPHKRRRHLGDFNNRLEMAQLTARDLPYISASDIEEQLPGTSYTYRTLEVLKEQNPAAELFFIMGADTVPELLTWKNPGRILELAAPVVVPRGGFSAVDVDKLRGILSDRQLAALRKSYLPVEPVDISSTAIREMAARGEDFDHFVPDAVARYIRQKSLYK